MHYLTSLWINLHKRGIQAMLLAGCLLGFGLGQTLGASYRPFADHAQHSATGRDGAAAVTNQAGGGLGNSVAGQQVARATPTPAPHVAVQTLQNKGHQANTANTDGSGGKKGDGRGRGHDGTKHPKARGHRTGNDGGPHGKQGKQGTDSGNKGQDNGGGHGQSNNQGSSITISLP